MENSEKKSVTFCILGEPKGKGRPRFRRMGNFVKTYNSEETTNYENLVKLSYHQECDHMLFEAKTMVECVITAYYKIPTSISNKKKQLMLNHKIRPTTKPDLDNLQKAIFDGLNGVAFHDDTQIVSIICNKFYSDEPRVFVTLSEVKEDE